MGPVPLSRCMYPEDVSSFRRWTRRHAAAAGTVPVTAAVRGAGDENFPDHRQGRQDHHSLGNPTEGWLSAG